MEWLSWALLGLLQGLTEFLPVSSSGHLVLAQRFLGVETPGVLLEVTVHLATAAAVVVLFARELWRMMMAVFRWPLGRAARDPGDAAWRGLVGMLLLATVVTSLIGFGFEPLIRGAFDTPPLAAAMLLVTGTILFASGRLGRGDKRLNQFRPVDAILVGLAQGAAILPGLSRSGLTIVAGLSRGLTGTDAARFSFLLSLPAILGAALVEGLRVEGLGAALLSGVSIGGLVLAFAAAFVSGLGAMVLLVRVVRLGHFHRFAWYCWGVGGVALAWLLL